MRLLTAEERMEHYTIPVTETGCLLWTAYCCGDGYGITVRGKRKLEKAHRMSWELKFGKIPTGMHILHKCDVRSCVNPAHLFMGTNKDNVLDKIAKGRSADQRGEKNGRAKLTSEIVKQIRASKISNAELAKTYSVSDVLIGMIKRRIAWKHL